MASRKRKTSTDSPKSRLDRSKPSKSRRARVGRLSADVDPKMIELSFDLDPKRSTFSGTASYEIELGRRRRSLELHSVGLRVTSVRLHIGDEILRGHVEEQTETESISLRFDRLLPIGPVRLDLSFRGRVRRDMRGLYCAGDRHAEGDEDGGNDEAWLASQLCPTDARRLFPCFDEPGIKARYRIRVIAPNDQTVLSNSPVELEEERGEGRKLVQFEPTPPLSSYLVAVAVGPFEPSPVKTSGTTRICVWTLPGKRHLTDFALECAAESLSRLERWFDTPHPYPKLDLVALPAFAFGAMENAGAVFFRDSILLLDAKEASLEDQKRTAEVVAHELSHMWFGNSVTMKWWNDLWLNEAFATWMAYEIIESWRPDWRIWLDFAHRREQALSMDALASSHPIAPPIRSAEEAQENFDAITYTKGASVLRMLERFLGADVFREGIRLYIRRHAEDNAEADDLWSALSDVSKEPVAKIVSPWTLQTGYPLVSVRRRGQKPVEFVQERFLSLPSRSKRVDPTRWTIPMVVRIGERRARKSSTGGEHRNFKRLLSKRRDSLTSKDSPFAWIHPNDGEAGFFRVDHGEIGHRELLAHLPALSGAERIGLLGNQWALCRAGRLSIDALLDLIAAVGAETDPDVLGATEHLLAQLGRRLVHNAGPEVEATFRNWICSVFEGQLDELGLAPRRDEEGRERLRRGQIFSIVGGHGRSETVVREAARRCAQHLAEGSPLAGEMAGPILGITAHEGGAVLHAGLRNATRKAATPQARRLYLFALSAFTNPELIDASLEAALDPELAPTPDRAQLIAELLANPIAATRTWHGLQRSWKKLEKQMPPILLARLAGATAYALPPSEAKGIADFFERKPLAAGTRVLRQIREELKIAARFERASGDDLAVYLGSRRAAQPDSDTDFILT